MLNAIIFDLDGTLLNTLNDLTDSLNVALKEYNFSSVSQEEVRSFLGGGIKVLVHRALKGKPNCDVYENNVYTRMKVVYNERKMNKTFPYLGIPELIKQLKAMHIKTAVISNKDENETIDIINHYFGENVFNVIRGKRHGVMAKPDPTSVFEVMKELKVHQEEVLYVGDSDVDMQTAINAGIRKIAVLWGYRDYNTLVAYSPDYIANDPSDILMVARDLHEEPLEIDEEYHDDYDEASDDENEIIA
ncbi:MAG: HAD family hydrolase [Bacilli bacterium]|nr:HAD family hydrolase [Bacilli bacterium]